MLNGPVKSAIIQYFRVRASPSGVVCGSLGNHFHGLCITSISQDSVNNPGFKKLIRVITPLMERAFLSSRHHCEVILIYKSWLAYRMHLSEYRFRSIIPAVLFGSYQHIAHPDRWLRETIRLRSFTDSPVHLDAFPFEQPLSRNECDNFMADIMQRARSLPRKLLLNNYSYVRAGLFCTQCNIHDICDVCKCVWSKCQFGDSSWVP